MSDVTANLEAVETSLTMDGLARSLVDARGGEADDPTYTVDDEGHTIFLDSDGEETDAEDVIWNLGGDSPAAIWLEDVLDITVHEQRGLSGDERVITHIDVLLAFGGPNITARFTADGLPEIIGTWWMDRGSLTANDELGVDDYLFELASMG